MNGEKAYEAVLDELKRYVEARCERRKDSKGSEWVGGMTVVSAEDKRIEEMARLAVEAVLRIDDGRPRKSVEARSLIAGDVFTYYSITKDGVAVDEELTVVKTTGTKTKPIITVRTSDNGYRDLSIEGHYLLSVYRPTLEDMREEFSNG